MRSLLGTKGAQVLARFAELDLDDDEALGARSVRARRRAGRRDRDAQEGLAALGRIHRDDHEPAGEDSMAGADVSEQAA